MKNWTLTLDIFNSLPNGQVTLSSFTHPTPINLKRGLPSPAAITLKNAHIAIQQRHSMGAKLGHDLVFARDFQNTVFTTVLPNTAFKNYVANTVFNTAILRSTAAMGDEKVRYRCATHNQRQPVS